MGSRPATELLQLPVNLHGIRLGQPVDLLLDEEGERALGLVVLCGDESERFLVLAAADVREDEIGVRSAFLLLEDVDFYRQRGQSLRKLMNGSLADVLLTDDGKVARRYPRGGVNG